MNNKINEVRKVKDFDLKAHLGQIKEKFGIGRSLKKFFEGLDSTLGQSE
jgi:hypothetical protein